ncbi:L,D-transpeptidase family protein [Ruixingdingia sedimenti]|uniref:L,D-transpeptidase family protein n=1 Tax=Ruixingdingia sedimenti TaxID=3073604 RepID=A0ABU1F6Y7_9RHOB|nr:L,D-transpeptidase family protein [Xinfangfangia sp. LG-4]MDR5652626.1 L,D-transpeptidase family protein [Xinfangfangia sp. LG-4]
MWFFRVLLVLAVAFGLTACGSGKFKRYHGPEVTRIEVHKSARRMYLLHHNEVLKSYRIGLGSNPVGHKQREGDGRTPEGIYFIDRQNPNSNFHLSVGISYPRPVDVEVARAAGVSPGGDIFIHGRAGKHTARGRGVDWTDGCIAVTDREMEEIYSMVRLSTPVVIYP